MQLIRTVQNLTLGARDDLIIALRYDDYDDGLKNDRDCISYHQREYEFT